MKKIGTIVRENLVSHIKEGIEKRNNTFLVSYKSLNGAQMNDFRKSLKRLGAKFYVSRNTIARRALNDLNRASLCEQLIDQTGFVWSDADSVEISKALIKFTKDFEGFSVHGGILEGKIIEKNDVKRLSDLPSRQVLLTMLVTTLQSPLSRLAGVLNGKTRELLSILKQISEKKGGK